MKLKVLKVIHGPDLMELWGGEVGLEKHTTYNPPPPKKMKILDSVYLSKYQKTLKMYFWARAEVNHLSNKENKKFLRLFLENLFRI